MSLPISQLDERVDTDTSTLIPVRADAEPIGLERVIKSQRDLVGASLVKRSMIAKAHHEQFERLALDH